MSYKTLNLDLSKDTKINPIINGRLGDGGIQTITINVTNRNVPVDLTGYTITFEGVTNSSQSKIFDSYGVKTETEKLKQGKFDYTFPSAAFSVAGRYETAYFSFQKDENRDTTGKIDIFVSENADIDAAEAETIITEYNKLVKELHAITDKYISDSDAKFADINAKIVDLQAKITQYQTTVKNTADSAVSTINTTKNSAIDAVNSSSNAAIKAVEDALKQFEVGDFYTKSESDSKFASIQAVDDKANDSEVVHLTGDETIAGKKTFTDDMVVKNIEVTGNYKKSTDTEMIDLPLSGVVSAKVSYQRKNGVVFVKGGGNWGNFEAKNERFVGTLPVGFRPASDWPSGMNAMGGSQSMSAKVTADGKVGITSDIKKDGVYGGFSMSFPVE